jgi:NAD(P)-dependent dehydrogenase (short-subunit alcohol dehydrogenase family)
MPPPSRIAVVTGGGSGIGRATALALVEAGWTVVATGRRMDGLQATLDLSPAPGRLSAIPCDVTEPPSVTNLFDQVAQRFGRLDLLFNNAGVSAPAVPIEDLDVGQWRTVVDTNLTGAFLCSQAAIRLMKAQSPCGGRIINNGSISAHAPRPNAAAYTAAKHAVTGLTKSIALDGRHHDIACGQIDIGNAATEMTVHMAQGVLQPSGERAPEPTMDVAHVARSVVHMANLPLDANVLFMTVMASGMPYVGRG